MADRYDLVIIGGGPAGLTAAIYGARARMRTLLIEKGRTGGQAALTDEVENYPGAGLTTGSELMQQFRAHAESLGATIVQADVCGLELDRHIKTIRTRKGDEYEARAVILCPGVEPRMLGVKGESRFRGKGVSYCATREAGFYTDLDVVVVGDGDAAVEEAIYLTKFANRVTLVCIHPEGTMDANKAAQERLFANPKIKVVWQSVVEEIQGDEIVTGVRLRNLATGEPSVLPCDGVFIFVGTTPSTEFLRGTGVDLDGRGYIIADPDTMATNIDGVYAAGDARRKWLRQIVTAAADGAIAACAAEKFLTEEEQINRDLLEPEEPVLVVFWSPAVPLSIEVLRDAEQVVAELGGQVRLARIDCYRSARTANRLGVHDVPTIMVFHQGIPLATLEEDFNHLAEWVAGHIPARI